MELKEKEITVLKDLQTQERTCVEKYRRYKELANDPELKNLFEELQQQEQDHFDTLAQAIKGNVPSVNCNCNSGKEYQPKATYSMSDDSEEKKTDCFLATDCIVSEKLVSGEYNTEVFAFGEPSIRKMLADIQIEEQNHAEMLYKYKTANAMA